MTKQHKKPHKTTQQKTQTVISIPQRTEKEQIEESISSADSPFHFWFKLLGSLLALLLPILYCAGRAYRNAYFYYLGLDEGTYPYSTQDYTYKGLTLNLISILILLSIFCLLLFFINSNKKNKLLSKKWEKIAVILISSAGLISILITAILLKDTSLWGNDIQNTFVIVLFISFLILLGGALYNEAPQVIAVCAFLLLSFGFGLCVHSERKGGKEAKLQKELIAKPEDPTFNRAFHLPKVTITLPIQTSQSADNANKTIEPQKNH